MIVYTEVTDCLKMRDGDCIKLEGKTREKMVCIERGKNNQKMSGSEEKKK